MAWMANPCSSGPRVSRRGKSAARRSRELERRRLEGRIGNVPDLTETSAQPLACPLGVNGPIAAELRAGAGYEGPAQGDGQVGEVVAPSRRASTAVSSGPLKPGS